mmetsp:Transcript_4762/g.15639  ORF Transcript_4762/g.15639 Transcript_4762/m.15639 type:complete len:369 (+) Transcript_4762:2285-3391(+)
MERRGGHLDKVRVGHGGHHPRGVAVAPSADSQEEHRPSGRFCARHHSQQLGPAILGPVLVSFARSVREVVTPVTAPRQRLQHIECVPQPVHGLTAADNGEEPAGRVGTRHARRQLLHPAVVVARVGDERQRQAGDLEGEARHGFARCRLNADGVPAAELACEGAGGQRAEEGGDGALAHARRVGGVVLYHARRRRVAERVRMGFGGRADQRHVHTAEGEHAKETGKAVELGPVGPAHPHDEGLPASALQHHCLLQLEDGLELCRRLAARLGQLVHAHRARCVDSWRRQQPLGHRTARMHNLDRGEALIALGLRGQLGNPLERQPAPVVILHRCARNLHTGTRVVPRRLWRRGIAWSALCRDVHAHGCN